jgi:dethiobiotin synthetase
VRPAKRIRGLLVAGTGTGVGKTVVASAIAAALAARGERVAVFKPAVTGLDEPGGPPPDHELLRASARSRQEADEVAPYRFGPPLSPHLAAEAAGVRIEPARLLERATEAATGADALIAEGVGGLMVPLAGDYLVRDLAIDLDLPLVIAASPALGTINHTLLTLEAARAVGLEVAAVVLTPWPVEAGELERSNRATIAALGRVEVATLPTLDTSSAARAVGGLPIDSWLRRFDSAAGGGTVASA